MSNINITVDGQYAISYVVVIIMMLYYRFAVKIRMTLSLTIMTGKGEMWNILNDEWMNETTNEFYNLYPTHKIRGSSSGVYSPAVDGN